MRKQHLLKISRCLHSICKPWVWSPEPYIHLNIFLGFNTYGKNQYMQRKWSTRIPNRIVVAAKLWTVFILVWVYVCHSKLPKLALNSCAQAIFLLLLLSSWAYGYAIIPGLMVVLEQHHYFSIVSLHPHPTPRVSQGSPSQPQTHNPPAPASWVQDQRGGPPCPDSFSITNVLLLCNQRKHH